MMTIAIHRPESGSEFLSMDNDEWLQRKTRVFFPDGMDRIHTDFPLAGVTICYKWQGHFVVASNHLEKWVLSDQRAAEIDLGVFNHKWIGCSATFTRD